MDDYDITELRNQKLFLTEVAEAKDLVSKSGGTLDTFPEVKYGKKKFTGDTKKKSLNPRWNQTFELAPDPSITTANVKIWSKGGFKNELLGEVEVKLVHEGLRIDKRIEEHYPLFGKDKTPNGDIKIVLEMEEGQQQTKKGETSRKKEKETSAMVIEEDIPIQDPDDVLFAGQKNRLEDLRKASGVNKAKKTDSMNQPFMEEYLDHIAKVKPSVRLIQTNNKALKELYALYFVAMTPEEREDCARQMTVLIDLTSAESSKLTAKFKEIESANAQAEKNFSLRRAEVSIRHNIYNVLSKTFLDSMLEFQDIQTQYKSMHRETNRRLYSISNPLATPEELEQVEEMDVESVLKTALMDNKKIAAKDALNYVKNKHKEILKIEASLLEIQRMFTDMAVLVAAQAEFIDRIQDNIHRAKDYVQKGNEELRKARHYQTHRFKISPLSMAKLMK